MEFSLFHLPQMRMVYHNPKTLFHLKSLQRHTPVKFRQNFVMELWKRSMMEQEGLEYAIVATYILVETNWT